MVGNLTDYMRIPMFESNLQNKCETNKNYYVSFANTIVLHVYFEDNRNTNITCNEEYTIEGCAQVIDVLVK